MVILLSLASPLAYAVSGIILYFSIKPLINSKWALIYSLIFLLSFGIVFYGLYEGIYGFHPDVLAGFFAVTFTLFLIQYEETLLNNRKITFQLIGFIIFYTLFMSLKEEVALLGILYFLITFFSKRSAFHRFFLITSVIIFISEMILIKLSQTPFNRTNSLMINSFFDLFKKEGGGLFYRHPEVTDNSLSIYWLSILSFIIIMFITILFLKRANIYAISLFIIGLVKMGFSFLIADFSLTTWHNFPGIVLLTGAIVIQLVEKERTSNKPLSIFIILIFIGSLIGFAKLTPSFFVEVNRTNRNVTRLITGAREDLREIKKFIEPDKVVAIPLPTAIEWVDGFRYSFYPRGVSMSPAGIAEYVILPNTPELRSYIYSDEQTEATLREEFSIMMQNEHVLLLKRIKPSQRYKDDYETFVELFGKEALGL